MARLFPQAAHSGSRSLVLTCSRIGYLHCLGASALGTTARSCHVSRRPAGSLWLAALGPATQSPNPDASARSDEQQLDVPLSQQLSRRRRAKAAPAPPADSDAAEGGPLPASTPRRGRPPKAASALTDNSSSTSQITTSTSSSLPLPDERATSSSGSNSSDSSSTGAAWQLGRSRDVAAGTAAGDGAAPAPGPPQHPAVTFRNAAELRQLLQARAAAAADDGGAPRGEEGQEAAGATQAAQPNTDSGGGAGPPPGAAGTSHRPAVPGPTALPPRRFFAAVPPGRSRDSGTSQFADASGSSRGSSSSNSSWGGRAGSSTPPPTAQARSSRVTHLPWKGGASRGSGDADSTDGAAGAAAEDGSWDHDKDYNKAKTYALRLLQRTPLAAGDLGRRLQERGHGRQAVAALLTWLADNGALNDALFARLYARSKWVGNLTAPAKIKKDLAAQGVAAAHVAAALTFVFGPSHRVRLSGHSLSAEEQEVQDMYLEAARKQVERRGGGGAGAGAGASGGDADDDDDDEGLAGGGSDSEREAAAAAFKERDRRRRRLGMWLQYRGHDMDLIIKTFSVLRI